MTTPTIYDMAIDARRDVTQQDVDEMQAWIQAHTEFRLIMQYFGQHREIILEGLREIRIKMTGGKL